MSPNSFICVTDYISSVNNSGHLLAAKISNRDNNRILAQTGLLSILSGQHIRVEPRQQRHSGRIMAKYLCLGDSVVERKGIGTTANIIILNLLAVKISKRENNQILARTGLRYLNRQTLLPVIRNSSVLIFIQPFNW